jgi:dihydrofolate reductase
MLSLIVAVSENNVIGSKNQLIWKLPADLKNFKELTQGHTIIMGRKTFESIGRALPNRRNIVVTRQADYSSAGIETAPSLEAAVQRVFGEPEVFVIGGGELYRETLPVADRIYLTRVHQKFEGDVTFSELGPEWREVSRRVGIVDEQNIHPHTFLVFERKTV